MALKMVRAPNHHSTALLLQDNVLHAEHVAFAFPLPPYSFHSSSLLRDSSREAVQQAQFLRQQCWSLEAIITCQRCLGEHWIAGFQCRKAGQKLQKPKRGSKTSVIQTKLIITYWFFSWTKSIGNSDIELNIGFCPIHFRVFPPSWPRDFWSFFGSDLFMTFASERLYSKTRWAHCNPQYSLQL